MRFHGPSVAALPAVHHMALEDAAPQRNIIGGRVGADLLQLDGLITRSKNSQRRRCCKHPGELTKGVVDRTELIYCTHLKGLSSDW
jgi:hypothetical protein